MNILVVSKTSIPAIGRTIPDWQALRDLGHIVWVMEPGSFQGTPDAIISMGVTVMAETWEALKRFPGVPLYVYQWDTYLWVWHMPRPGEYDYHEWGRLLSKAKEIWVPSACTGRRVAQWWDLRNWRVILSSAPYWEHDAVSDDGYALCTLREIPDPWFGMFKQACEELYMPYKMTNHELGYAEYQEAVARCRFLVSHYYEASTGGLTLLEGHYLGKPALLSDSPWHGGRDYLSNRATYFRGGDMTDFKVKLMEMYCRTPKLDREACRSWVATHYSDRRMVTDMIGRIQANADARAVS